MNYKSILLLALLSSVIYSQTEYKVSAEGFTFGKPVGNTVILTVFDVTGKEITTLVNQQLVARIYKDDFNPEILPVGCIFIN